MQKSNSVGDKDGKNTKRCKTDLTKAIGGWYNRHTVERKPGGSFSKGKKVWKRRRQQRAKKKQKSFAKTLDKGSGMWYPK